MTGKQDEAASLAMVGVSAQRLMSIVSVGVVVFGAGWYMASQEGGGDATQTLQAQVAVMDGRLSTALNGAKEQQAQHAAEISRLLRDIAALTVQIERLRAETEVERRAREQDAIRSTAETAWLRQQLLDLKASAAGGGRRQSDDGIVGPEDIHPPSQQPQSHPDTREALSPFPPRFIFR